jgi:hypothetical protein
MARAPSGTWYRTRINCLVVNTIAIDIFDAISLLLMVNFIHTHIS